MDEGGNAIDVAFGPLTYTGAYTSTSGEGAGSTGIGVLSLQGGSGGGGSGGGGLLHLQRPPKMMQLATAPRR